MKKKIKDLKPGDIFNINDIIGYYLEKDWCKVLDFTFLPFGGKGEWLPSIVYIHENKPNTLHWLCNSYKDDLVEVSE
jgi:hypothetical protein